jgi:hypothetical protein
LQNRIEGFLLPSLRAEGLDAMVHGIWHLDKGILYTLQGVLKRPGKLAREYVAGKRAGHFSLVTMLVLLVGLLLYIFSYKTYQRPDIRFNGKPVPGYVEFMARNLKWALLVMVPIMAKASKDLFKMLRFNYTEHVVMNGFFYAGMLFIALAFSPLYFIPGINKLVILAAETLAIGTYVVRAYRQATRDLYVPGIFARLITIYFFSVIGYVMFMMTASVMVYNIIEKIFLH